MVVNLNAVRMKWLPRDEEKVSSIANTGSLRMLMALTVLNTSF